MIIYTSAIEMGLFRPSSGSVEGAQYTTGKVSCTLLGTKSETGCFLIPSELKGGGVVDFQYRRQTGSPMSDAQIQRDCQGEKFSISSLVS
jgi:hypothetical protein